MKASNFKFGSNDCAEYLTSSIFQLYVKIVAIKFSLVLFPYDTSNLISCQNSLFNSFIVK